ncbi:hypothetical protein SK128_002906 [Halocaridina rubra]|uniref:Uncharacterized protein n=1 Tax=Halocaridina rubra TaxID=373956 RepID=A0AAN8WNQ3_HALRR
MVLKGLPPYYKTLCTVVIQREAPMTFQEFTAALRSIEESEKYKNPHKSSEDNVMNVNSKLGESDGGRSQTIGKNDTCELTPLPDSLLVIGGIFIYTKKLSSRN